MPETQCRNINIMFRSDGNDYKKKKKISHAVEKFLIEVYKEDYHV